MKRALKFTWRIITAPARGFITLCRYVLRVILTPFHKVRVFFTDTSQTTSNPLGEALGTVVKQPSSMMPHLLSMRKHIFRSILAIVLFSTLAFAFIKPILSFLANPLPGGLDVLTAIDVTENIGSVMKVALLCGFAVSIPYVTLELYLFFAPAIKPASRLGSLIIIPFALVFFVAGMAFAYYVMLPTALPFLFNFMGLNTQPRPSSYFNFITAIMFWIGIFFEFPLVAYLLARIGFLRPQTLIAQWRLAIVIMAVLAALITPTVDPINMALVMGPMMILYIIAILFTSIAQNKRDKSQEKILT